MGWVATMGRVPRDNGYAARYDGYATRDNGYYQATTGTKVKVRTTTSMQVKKLRATTGTQQPMTGTGSGDNGSCSAAYD